MIKHNSTHRGKCACQVLTWGRKPEGTWVYGFWHDLVSLPVISEFDFNKADYVDHEIDPETLCFAIGLIDTEEETIFTGDIFVPYYITPDGFITDELDYDNKGIVVKDSACYSLERKGRRIPMNNFVEKVFDRHVPNEGEIYKLKNNIALGKIIGNIFDKED